MIMFERKLTYELRFFLKQRYGNSRLKRSRDMRNLIATLKIGDIMIIILLLLISFTPFFIFTWQQTQVDGEKLMAIISLENEVIHQINLSEHEGHEIFDIVTHDHEINTIELLDGRIQIKSATCNDQVCVRTGFINRAGQTIICLPHQLVIEIQNVGDEHIEDDQVDIISS